MHRAFIPLEVYAPCFAAKNWINEISWWLKKMRSPLLLLLLRHFQALGDKQATSGGRMKATSQKVCFCKPFKLSFGYIRSAAGTGLTLFTFFFRLFPGRRRRSGSWGARGETGNFAGPVKHLGKKFRSCLQTNLSRMQIECWIKRSLVKLKLSSIPFISLQFSQFYPDITHHTQKLCHNFLEININSYVIV